MFRFHLPNEAKKLVLLYFCSNLTIFYRCMKNKDNATFFISSVICVLIKSHNSRQLETFCGQFQACVIGAREKIHLLCLVQSSCTATCAAQVQHPQILGLRYDEQERDESNRLRSIEQQHRNAYRLSSLSPKVICVPLK